MVSEHASPLALLGGADAGGQNVHVAALAAALARRGHEVVVYTRRDDAALPDRVAFADGAVVEHVDAGPARFVPKDALWPLMPEFAAGLRAAWRRRRPHLVHAHFWMSGWASLEAARPISLPVVQTFHALGVVKRRHQGAADTSPAVRVDVERELAERMHGIVATCRDEVEELREIGANMRNVRIVPCGVDLACFRPDGPIEPRARGLRRLVVVTRLVPRKGVEDVIRALPALPRTELVVAGGPDAGELPRDPEARRLRALAAVLGVGDRLVLRGRVDHAAVPALLRSADIVVCAPWYEPFGIVPVEAMACGVPLVATAVGGLLDTVVDGVTGVLVPPRDPAALVRALHALLQDAPARRSLGASGAVRAHLGYGWEHVASATCSAYAAMGLETRRNRRARSRAGSTASPQGAALALGEPNHGRA
jgi:glycosyltransferase involved in cell wall biosynthesis